MMESPETLLSRVNTLLSMTNPDTFQKDTDATEYNSILDNKILDIHLLDLADLATSSTEFSLIPTKPSEPSPLSKSPRKLGKKSPRKKLPMDMWNMNRSPPKHTHPYLRLASTKEDRYKSATILSSRTSRASRTSPNAKAKQTKTSKTRSESFARTRPERKGRTLKLSATERIDRQNESILRKFVGMLTASRSVYGTNPETLRELFQAVDKDCSGTIEFNEFQQAMTRLGLGLVQDEITALANAIDDNGDGIISYHELVTSVSAIVRKKASRHLDNAQSHAATVASRHFHKNSIQKTSDLLVTRFVELLLNQRKSLTQCVEKLRRAFLEADEKKNGQIPGNVFVNVVRDSGIDQNQIARIALGLLEDKVEGQIWYHEFLDSVSRKLRNHIRREKLKAEKVARTLTFNNDELVFFSNISRQILKIVRSSDLSKDLVSKVEEFMDPKMNDPRLEQESFFHILSTVGITLSSAALLILYSVLRFDERNAIRMKGILDTSVSDARVAKMHAINEAKIISKFKVMHKSHVKQRFAVQVENVKERRVEKFRLRLMSRVLDRLEDGGAIEIRFQNALNKIRTTLRMASDGDDTLDIMQIFQLFDEDGDGEVSRDEFLMAVDMLGCDLSQDEADVCFSMLDPTGDGGIDLNEFRYAWFNKGKITRTIPNKDDKDDISSVYYEKKLRQNAIEELEMIENSYSEKAKLILGSVK